MAFSSFQLSPRDTVALLQDNPCVTVLMVNCRGSDPLCQRIVAESGVAFAVGWRDTAVTALQFNTFVRVLCGVFAALPT